MIFFIYFQIFDYPTKLFSEAEVPLIPEAIPMLVKIRWGLEKIRDDTDDLGNLLPSPFRIAAQATLLLVNKYLDLMLNTELYIVATGGSSLIATG